VRLDDVVVVQHDGTTALSHVSLHVEHGELLGVIGPSGSGKTTLLRAVAGLAEVRQGEILIDGRRVTRLPTQERNVAMAFESGAVMPLLDVAGNLALGLELHHVPQPEVTERVLAEARHLRLSRLLSRRPATLSAGERSRVGVGRALVRVPAVWLLDEPLAHLDAGERFGVRHRLTEKVRRLGVTTLYVTHDSAEALAVADRVAVLRQGELVQVAAPKDLYGRPGTVFVASFVGTPAIGLLPARVVASRGLGGFVVGPWTLPYWGPLPPELRPFVGRDVILGLRPEHVHDAGVEDNPSFARVTGTVTSVEFTPPDFTVAVALDVPPVSSPDLPQAHAALHARFSRRNKVRPGTSVTVVVDVTRAHVFDPLTGLAVWHPSPDA
jgi:multiple sugar transport system ATP-binding protein